ncbi:hypothetical protein D3C76_1685270 [compost metagenome]
MRFPLFIDQTEGVNSKPFHHPEAARNGAVRHQPHRHMGRFLIIGDEIPEGIMG